MRLFKVAKALHALTDRRDGARRGGWVNDACAFSQRSTLDSSSHKHHGKGNCLFSTLLLLPFHPTHCDPTLVAFVFKLMKPV